MLHATLFWYSESRNFSIECQAKMVTVEITAKKILCKCNNTMRVQILPFFDDYRSFICPVKTK